MNRTVSSHGMINPVKWLRSGLRSHVTLRGFFLYLAAVLLSICFFVFVNASQAFILTNIIGVNTNKLGGATGSLALYDELVSLAFVLVWGVLSDKIGRRSVYSLGFLIIGIATVIFPLASNLYPQLLLIRLLFAVGAASTSCMLTAVLADFVGDSKRGFMSGTVGLVSGIGALLALFLFLPLPVRLESISQSPVSAIRITYGIVGSISIIFCVFLWGFLGNAPCSSELEQVDESETNSIKTSESITEKGTPDATEEIANAREGRCEAEKKGYLSLAKEGVRAGRSPLVALAYLGGFIARADSIILTLFITLYVNRQFVENGVCDVFDANSPSDVIKELCPASFTRASILSGIAQTCSLLGAAIYALVLDRVPRTISLAVASLIGFFGFLLFCIVDNAESVWAIIAIVLMGFGQIGMIVVSLSLVTISQVPADIRGSVAGVYSFFGAVGILFCSRLGGALFDSWRGIAPFVILAVFHAIAFISSITVWMIGSVQQQNMHPIN